MSSLWGACPAAKESARATLLQRGYASRGSSTESVRATFLQRGDASRGSFDRVYQSDLAAERRCFEKRIFDQHSKSMLAAEASKIMLRLALLLEPRATLAFP